MQNNPPAPCNALKKYHLLSVVGRGAHGVAHLAESPQSPMNQVVVKQIYSQLKSMYWNEMGYEVQPWRRLDRYTYWPIPYRDGKDMLQNQHD
ncbi:hypothetical protein HMI56_007311 [Coelomomyces lativittatus]|nr:hypothetical protein HMI56_007311 [Coelomomyces lativittatus]